MLICIHSTSYKRDPGTVSEGLKKISAKAITQDLKGGMTDADLMKKYGLSFQALQDLFAKLTAAKIASPDYFTRRAMKQAKVKSEPAKARICPYCGYSSKELVTRCPRCDQDASEWLDTVELTKILSF